jgi:PAS domain S-box-containing protein
MKVLPMKEREDRFRLALKVAGMVAWDWHIAKNDLRYSNEPEMVFGTRSYGLKHSFDTFLNYVHPEDRKAVKTEIDHALSHKNLEYKQEFRILSGESQVRWMLSSATILRDNTGKAYRMTGVMWDITEHRETEEALRKLNLELEERIQERTVALARKNEELEAFVYSVSHDLKVPLQAMMGFIEIIRSQYRPQVNDVTGNYLGRLQAKVERMAEIINDLLTLSRAGKQKLKLDAVNISDLVQEMLQEKVEEEANRKAKIDISPNLLVNADVRFLKIVLENLLGNAWKYSRKKSVAEISFGHNGNAFFIKDNGAGFDMQYANQLFQPFKRLHSEKDFSGTGIGLVTVQRIIERHGGKIWAEAEINQGATFFFTLGD